MIQVCTVNISNITQQGYTALYAKASPERKLRADRCNSRENAACCLVSEALLRYAVKQALGLSEFTLEINAYGKPGIQGREDFHFNISHSGSWVVLAWGSTPVGIDVEQSRTRGNKERIVRRFFAPQEQQFVLQPGADLNQRFLEMWTAKESYLKFLGTGLQKPLDSFDVCTMTTPGFYTHWLEESCMTLCTTEEGYQLSEIEGELLCVM